MSSLSDLHAEGVTDLRAYNIGRDDERERIIKLLESRKQHEILANYDRSAANLNAYLNATIALIKGEK